MVTGEWLRQKLVEPLKEQQRQEGRVEAERQVHSQWRAWNKRRLEAEANGEHFDEPTPKFQNSAQDRNG